MPISSEKAHRGLIFIANSFGLAILTPRAHPCAARRANLPCRMTGDAGDDTIRAVGDTKEDFINCGEDADGQDVDTAYINSQDAVDEQNPPFVTTVGLSCEALFVDGIRVPQVNTP